MAKSQQAFPVAEAANIDSQISSTAQRLFGQGTSVSSDLQTLKALLDRRAALLAPPAAKVTADRLRAIKVRLQQEAKAIRATADLD